MLRALLMVVAGPRRVPTKLGRLRIAPNRCRSLLLVVIVRLVRLSCGYFHKNNCASALACVLNRYRGCGELTSELCFIGCGARSRGPI